MDTASEPTKHQETDGEPSAPENWHDEGPEGHRSGSDLLRSALPLLVGSVAVGIAAVAIVVVQISRRRKPETLLHRATVRVEGARKALTHAAAGLPERGKSALRRVHR